LKTDSAWAPRPIPSASRSAGRWPRAASKRERISSLAAARKGLARREKSSSYIGYILRSAKPV
jgi:hypothetical protein